MAVDLTDFDEGVRRFAQRQLPEVVATATKKIAFDILDGVDGMMPVDTGRARGNNQVTLDVPAEGTVERFDLQPGGAAKQEGDAVIASANPFQPIWLSNNLPYIKALENGWSQQAAGGMYQVTIDRVTMSFKL